MSTKLGRVHWVILNFVRPIIILRFNFPACIRGLINELKPASSLCQNLEGDSIRQLLHVHPVRSVFTLGRCRWCCRSTIESRELQRTKILLVFPPRPVGVIEQRQLFHFTWLIPSVPAQHPRLSQYRERLSKTHSNASP
jgi:hypothetical protein